MLRYIMKLIYFKSVLCRGNIFLLYMNFLICYFCDRKLRRGRWRIWDLMKKGWFLNIKVMFCVVFLINVIIIVLLKLNKF